MDSKINIDDNEKTKSQYKNEQNIRILGIDLTNYSPTTRFLLCCAGVFFFYLLYGYLQELIFTLKGFEPYGWFLTLIQFFYYSIFGLIEINLTNNFKRLIPIKIYLLLAALTLGTMGFSNASLGYLNYPTQVIFKSCKLVPVLIGSILIQGKRYKALDFVAAILMCIGLTEFTLADSRMSPNFNTTGIIMISLALLCDAVIGNVQEKAMKEFSAPNAEVVLYSYSIGFIYLFIILLATNNLLSGIQFCAMHPYETYGYGLLFSLTGYLGIQIVLTLVCTCGAPTAASVTTARKAVTIALSFIFFNKPFTMQYVWSGCIVLLGIYLNMYSKRNPDAFNNIKQTANSLYYSISDKIRKRTHSPNRRLLINI